MPSISIAQEKAVWVDVRTPYEWDKGHLKNAVLIPYNEIATKIQTVVKDRKQLINLYCGSGRRAEVARETLVRMGYTNVQNRGRYEQLRKIVP
ncbi:MULTISPECIES: rhodanese-like domain-containing protein [Pasteurellaceae]|uniref:rhodanese-like domain-containing protein n=1 Tax=Pasteurellaceae TaxID=712 RepID=UPI0027671423|nr:rhodanese-like domain-containing protein [Pasteurella atlantica]MDP8039987.1 rhodanese-like domain-containing protein [Pasteurella atlantica]MDP8089853.1 rhodanese-like domain-containing protein [Pasteurella atlantica]MDP8142950.1 rhodanese-like domain-containing protein [Pasteurella atlantica]MDP8167073.1 rhodanese-like domain-containing protein [Pasteurella atlantica]